MVRLKTFVICILFSLKLIGSEPLRIVSLAQSVSVMIEELGGAELIVGCTNYCPVKEQKQTKVVASAIDANIELIATLQPDLVFTTSLNKPQTIETFKKLGIHVVHLPYPKSYSEICAQFKIIAENIGKKTLADSIINETNRKLELLVPERLPAKIFFQIGSNPLFTVVPNTFMNDIITYSGAKNIAHDLTIGAITREKVILENPDFIFIVSMGITSDEEIKNWSKFKHLTAIQKHQIYHIDSNIACTPTPKNFYKSVELVIQHLQKDNK